MSTSRTPCSCPESHDGGQDYHNKEADDLMVQIGKKEIEQIKHKEGTDSPKSRAIGGELILLRDRLQYHERYANSAHVKKRLRPPIKEL